MKNILRAIMSLLLFVACTTTEESPSSVPNGGNESVTPSITLEQNYLNFDEHADVQTISFSSTMDWTAELINDRADGWCSISATSGSAGSKDIDVTVTENTSTDDRTASVIIKSGAISKTVRISQKQRDALTVTSSTFEIEGTSGKIYIEVKANVDFEYTIDGSAAEWITPIETRALKTTTLGFNIAENKTMQRREGTITIHSGDLSETVTVYQKDHGDAILLSQNEYVVSDTGEDIAVEVTSNVDVEIEMPDVDWITRNTSRAVSTNTYYFTIAENTSYDQREAYITFTNKAKNISEKVKITQKNLIVCAKNEYIIEKAGGILDFDIQTNVEVSVSISESAKSWITYITSRALRTQTLHFDIAAYDKDDIREGVIILSCDGVIQEITIKQIGTITLDTPNSNEIYYTTDNQEIIKPNMDDWDVPVVSNIYNKEKGYGIVTFDRDIEEIGYREFAGCTTLTSIAIPTGVTIIKEEAFSGCDALHSIAIPDGVVVIEQLAFGGCDALVNITFPNSVTEFRGNPFYGCSALEAFYGRFASEDNRCLIINRKLNSFAPSGLTSYNIPNGVNSIGDSAFNGCSNLTSITIPDSVTAIGSGAFSGCYALSCINIPEGITKIGTHAFSSCDAITSITIPDKVTSIGYYAFGGCDSLSSIYCKAITPPTLDVNVFDYNLNSAAL